VTQEQFSDFNVTGTVERIPVEQPPTEPTGFYDDADNDATTSVTEILDLAISVTPTHVDVSRIRPVQPRGSVTDTP
jgi:hypothetical protein